MIMFDRGNLKEFETIKSPTTSDNSLTPAVSYYGTKTRV